jgi:hypothetical protein
MKKIINMLTMDVSQKKDKLKNLYSHELYEAIESYDEENDNPVLLFFEFKSE